LEKYYKELIKSAEDRKCAPVDTIKSIIEEYERLKSEKVEDLESNLPFYSKASYQHEVDIEKACR